MKSIFLTGASGVGKSTTHRLLNEYGFKPIPNHLSREPRPGEMPGLDAKFVTRSEFEESFSRGEYLEQTLAQAEYGGVYYGSPVDWISHIAVEATAISATPANVSIVAELCQSLEDKGSRKNLLWVNLVAPLDVRRARLECRGYSEEKITQRLFMGVSHGEHPDADLNLCTYYFSSQNLVREIMRHCFKAE